MPELQPDFYRRFMVGDTKIDYYFIADLYEVTDPCISHILKKALRAGRSHKTLRQDMEDIINTALRWKQLHTESDSQPMCAISCDEAGKGELVEVIPQVYSVHYFPCVPTWLRDEVAMVYTWTKPGWYVIETSPYDSVMGGEVFDEREQALAHANADDFAVALPDGSFIGTIGFPVNRT